jgi:hypothetical protein
MLTGMDDDQTRLYATFGLATFAPIRSTPGYDTWADQNVGVSWT